MNNYDIFNKMTKEQIIDWLKKNTLLGNFPTEIDIAFYNYLKAFDKDQEKWKEHIDRGKKLKDSGWEKDDKILVEQTNSETDINKKLRLLQKLKKIREPWEDHLAETKSLMKQQEKTELLYKKYLKLRDDEIKVRKNEKL